MIRRIAKYVAWMLSILTAILALYGVTALVLSLISSNPPTKDCFPEQTIYVASNGVHLDLILHRDQFTDHWLREISLTENAQFLAFGWGDKEFYMNTPEWSDLSMARAIRATFVKTDAALHLSAYQFPSEHWLAVPLCSHQFQALINYINRSFKTHGNGGYIEIPHSGYTSYDSFFEANGNYTFINTCNQWVNQGLKAAGVKTALWSPFDRGVLYQLSRQVP